MSTITAKDIHASGSTPRLVMAWAGYFAATLAAVAAAMFSLVTVMVLMT